MVAVASGLFRMLDIPLGWLYEWVAAIGAYAVPVVALFIAVRLAPRHRLAGIVSRVFAPLFLALLVGYLGASVVTGAGFFHDREDLLAYNVTLICVLGVVIFASRGEAATEDGSESGWPERLVAVLLAAVVPFAVLGLIAIARRIGDHGMSPNRLAVLGENTLLLGNACFALWRGRMIFSGKNASNELEKATAEYLPLYAVWFFFAVFAMPLVF